MYQFPFSIFCFHLFVFVQKMSVEILSRTIFWIRCRALLPALLRPGIPQNRAYRGNRAPGIFKSDVPPDKDVQRNPALNPVPPIVLFINSLILQRIYIPKWIVLPGNFTRMKYIQTSIWMKMRTSRRTSLWGEVVKVVRHGFPTRFYLFIALTQWLVHRFQSQ